MIERTSFNIFARPNVPPAEEPAPTPEPKLSRFEEPSPSGRGLGESPRTAIGTRWNEPAPQDHPIAEIEPLAPHPDPLPEGEGADVESEEEEPPLLASSAGEQPVLSLALATPYPALANQLALTPQAAITLHVALPEHTPAPLASTTGLYQPTEHDAPQGTPQGTPQTGLATGTRILTARGEIPVEALEPGDVALGLRGPALLPIAWIGRAQAAKPGVQIEPGALGPGTPRRTLRLAADHPVFVEPHPVPARSLVNGSSIQAVELDGAELFHIDVGPSDVLFAEGVPLSSDHRSAP